ncbi:hypothetical protein OAV48_00875 [bacterium]|nr:hypothetical protein [bacterium]
MVQDVFTQKADNITWGFVDQSGNAYTIGGTSLENALSNFKQYYPEAASSGKTFRVQDNNTETTLLENYNPARALSTDELDNYERVLGDMVTTTQSDSPYTTLNKDTRGYLDITTNAERSAIGDYLLRQDQAAGISLSETIKKLEIMSGVAAPDLTEDYYGSVAEATAALYPEKFQFEGQLSSGRYNAIDPDTGKAVTFKDKETYDNLQPFITPEEPQPTDPTDLDQNTMLDPDPIVDGPTNAVRDFDYSDLNRSMTFDEFMRSDKYQVPEGNTIGYMMEEYTSPYGTGGETINADRAQVNQYENYVRDYYSPYQHSSGEDTFALVEGEMEDINQYKALGYNDEDIKKLLSDKYDYRATPIVEEVDQGSMMDNMVGADDDLEASQPIDDTPEPVAEPIVEPEPVAEPVITPTPTYSMPSTPSFTTQPMSSGTYQSPTVTQPQFTGPVNPYTGTYQLQQGMAYAPSNVQFNVPQISTGVLNQGQAMGYNPTLSLYQPQGGYMPTFQYNEGGMVPNTMQQQPASAMPMTQSTFGGFKPEAMQRIAGSLGYQGDMAGFDGYLNANPDKKQKMDMYNQKAMQMAKGGVIHANEGTYVPSDPRPLGQQYIPQQDFTSEGTASNVQDVMATQALFPGLPAGATVVPVGVTQEAGQFIDPTSGQVYGSSALPTALATTTQAGMPQATATTLMTAATGAEAVDEAVSGMQPAQGEVSDQALVTGQQGVSSLNIDAAQGTATMMTNPVTREIQEGELISGAADAQKAAKFSEQIQAATAQPSEKATVQGQLEGLMQQFEGGDTPAWAAGAMRNAMGAMAARGLGASSLAGQAAVQAAMESALPIAQADAQTQAKFESQNLSNRQQRAMLAAQQRAQFIGQEFDQAFQSRVMNASKISDAANMNFTAEQQVALENSRAANSMNLANLSNRQAGVMAEAAAIANMDMANLNNRQQAAVMNAQSFLQMDMANLSNKQQTELFQAQQRVQSLFNDQAAMNAAAQFNASSQNQTDQFFANLASQTSQFNASQANAQSQFNAGQTNVIERFNTEINNQREQFNASNRLVIDQANATWRREIATMDTAAVNRANETNAEALLDVSRDAYNNLWQYYSDNMEWAWTSAENEKERYINMAMAELNSNTNLDLAAFKADYQSSIGFGNMIGKILTTDLTGSLGGSILGDVFDIFG